MPRKPANAVAKAHPLQVRFSPEVLARIKKVGGPDGASEFVRRAVDDALLQLDRLSSQPASVTADTAPFGTLMEAVHLLTESNKAASHAQAQQDESTSQRLAALQATTQQLGGLMRQVAALTTLLAKPLGVSESEMGRVLESLKAGVRPAKK